MPGETSSSVGHGHPAVRRSVGYWNTSSHRNVKGDDPAVCCRTDQPFPNFKSYFTDSFRIQSNGCLKYQLVQCFIKQVYGAYICLHMPGNKFDGNNSIGGQFSLGFVEACNGWSEANAEGRKAIWEAHKQYTLEFRHFLVNDPAVPEIERVRGKDMADPPRPEGRSGLPWHETG